METRPVRIAVDIGGTFTDLQILDARTSNIVAWKTPTTPADPSEGLMTGVREAAEKFGFALSDVGLLLHALDGVALHPDGCRGRHAQHGEGERFFGAGVGRGLWGLTRVVGHGPKGLRGGQGLAEQACGRAGGVSIGACADLPCGGPGLCGRQ